MLLTPAAAASAATCSNLQRYEVKMDNSCLFASIAYLCSEGESLPERSVVRQLRSVCAQEALDDPDRLTRELVLGRPVDEYANWIQDEDHWGGESEVLALAKHYSVEVAIASCESLRMLVYGENAEAPAKHRIYLLYTGQHYDALLGVAVDGSRHKLLPCGENEKLESSALEIAKQNNEEAARLAKQRKVKRIKCGGCGALLEDTQAFQEHCGDVDHGDSFAYDCAEVEIVLDEAPEGILDLQDTQRVYCFNNADPSHIFSMLYPAPIRVDGRTYGSLEHFWGSARFAEQDVELFESIASAPTAEEARSQALAADLDKQRPLWAEERSDVLTKALGARLDSAVGDQFKKALIRTGAKIIVNVDTDKWLGMQAPGGIPTGRNHLGQALARMRDVFQQAESRARQVEIDNSSISDLGFWCCAG